jgi:hypothetical protein
MSIYLLILIIIVIIFVIALIYDYFFEFKFIDKYDNNGKKIQEIKSIYWKKILNKTWKYDDYCNMIEEAYYNNGLLIQKKNIKNIYDNNGNRIEEVCYDFYDKLEKKTTWVYDNNSNIIEEYLFDKNEILIEKNIWNFIDNNCQEKLTYNKYLNLIGFTKFEYFDNSNIIKKKYEETHYGEAENFTINYKYDETGNITEKSFYNSNNNLFESHFFKYNINDKTNEIIEIPLLDKKEKKYYKPIEFHLQMHIKKMYSPFINKYEIQYNNYGNILKEIGYSYDGKIKEKFIYDYDEEGNMIKVEGDFSIFKNEKIFKIKNIYNEKNLLIEQVSYNSNNNTAFTKHKYVYNIKLQLIQENIYTIDDNLVIVKKWVYNENNKVIEQIILSPNNIVKEKKDWKYNKNDQIIEEIWYLSKKRNISYFIYNEQSEIIEEYHSSSNRKIKYFNKIFNKDKVTSEVWKINNFVVSKYNFKFDLIEFLNCIEETNFNKDGKKTVITNYPNKNSIPAKNISIYDKKGKILEESTYNSNGNLQTNTIYKYDKKGNLIL